MTTLFIDCSYTFQFGILDDAYHWIEYGKLDTTKSASLFHQTIHQLLSRHQIDLKEVKQLIVGAGPGSYTSVKVVDGFKQMANLFGINTFSYWSFEIPLLAGHTAGAWIASAYKKEVFIETWKDQSFQNKLISEEDFGHYLKTTGGNFFTSSNEFEIAFKQNAVAFVNTDSLIQNVSHIIFPRIVAEDKQREVTYFRALDQEYKLTQPQFARP